MLPENKWKQFGEDGLIVHGLIIHNTGNNLSAEENYNILLESKNSNGCHFFIDNKQIIQCLPETWKCYTTGKGEDWAYHNCLSLEICNLLLQEDWEQCEVNAKELIKEWLNEFNLTRDDIYYHNDFNQQFYCPNKLLDLYGTKKNWLDTFIN